MIKYAIPKYPGKCSILFPNSATPMVVNDRKAKNKIHIPCSSLAQAEEVLEKIKSKSHDGTIEL